MPREISIRRIYSKYVPRMVVAYIVWSGIYASVALFTGGGFDLFWEQFISGHYHMWFVPMIVGIYICIPFIRQIIKDKKVLKYFLWLSFVFVFLLPQIVTLANDFASERLIQIVQNIYGKICSIDLHMVLGYVFYFVLGYFLNNVEMSKKQRRYVYLLGAVGFLLTIVLDLAVALKTQTCCQNYYSYFSINVMLESIAVFIAFKYAKFKNDKVYRIMTILSKYSFGAYLVHVLVIELLSKKGLNTLSFNPIVSVPIIGIVVFVISYLISAVCNKIPKINQYIV